MADMSARPSRSAPQARARGGPARGLASDTPTGGGLAGSKLARSGLDRSNLAPMEVAGRIARLRKLLEEAGCEALLVSSHSNVRYLTGFTGSAGLLMVRADDAVIVTDGRYGEQAPAELALSGARARTEALGGAKQVELLGELVKGIGRLGLEGEHIVGAARAEVVRGLGQGRRAGP